MAAPARRAAAALVARRRDAGVPVLRRAASSAAASSSSAATGPSSPPHSPPQPPPHALLSVASLVNAFRSRGHLHARLDALQRVKRGPWLSEEAGGTVIAGKDPALGRVLAVLDDGARHHPHRPHPAADGPALAAALGLPPAAGAAVYDLSHPGVFPAGPPVCGGGLDPAAVTLPALASSLAAAWAGSLAAEVDHLPPDQQVWLASRLEARPGRPRDPASRRATLRLLARSAAFEAFLAAHFPRSKRFGVEGLDALVPAVAAAAERCAAHGVARLHVGLTHRGRLNLVQNVLRAPAGQVFAEMEASQSEFQVGDVKYHLGRVARLGFPAPGGPLTPPLMENGAGDGGDGGPHKKRSLLLSVAPNPSHLEAVGPVVLGLVRAQQDRLGAAAVAGLLLHGDAAFAGLGVVSETLSLSRLPGFSVGGTVHVIANNAVGFTTDPAAGRSGPHPSDGAKNAGGPIPVLHACADDPDAVVDAAALAADWRAAWGCDIILDVVGYRRHGHNELDDPAPAQPRTASRIAAHPPVVDLYAAALGAEGVYESPAAARSAAAAWAAEATEEYASEHAAFLAGAYAQTADDWVRSSWQGAALEAVSTAAATRGGLGAGGITQRQEPTGLPLDTLRWVGRRVTSLPPGFEPTPSVAAALAARRSQVEGPHPRVDFATAEALAFGSLALHKGAESGGAFDTAAAATPDSEEGGSAGLNVGAYAVRLSGQDVERGTFGQRHAALRERGTGRRAVPLDAMRPGAQERVWVWNSALNEGACAAFEYGYSLGAAGRALVAWEAQFGDFANGAQAAVDLFVAAAEERWAQQSGLVLLLPHGYEGQGPDHSSARLERFLQLCNDDGDALPGDSPRERQEVDAAFDALAREGGSGCENGHPVVDRARATQLLAALGAEVGNESGGASSTADALWAELGLPSSSTPIDRGAWRALMTRFLRRNAEARANLFVVCPTTPAQLFHALRRQLNRARPKPLVVAAPKWLHVHSAATSALADLGTGTHFTRVIADGDPRADNTRHRGVHPDTGAPHAVPAHAVRRVLLCTGPVYYHLLAARRARRVRDVVLARVEQLSPLAHDEVAAVVGAYPAADVVWVQEEPKNQGAWRHVKPRVDTALRELLPWVQGDGGNGGGLSGGSGAPRTLRYIGRPPSGTTATASMAIHRAELRGIIEDALGDGPLVPTGAEGLASSGGGSGGKGGRAG
jgi:2-oxoglutarate dehydrogenase E1 component